MKRRHWPALGLALAVAGLAVGCGGSGENGGDVPPADRTAPFPLGFRVLTLTGGEIALDDLRGQVVLVDLFGTWSDACRQRVPTLVSFHVRYQSRGLRIVGLAYERVSHPDEARALVSAFAERHRIPYPLALGPESVKEQIPGGFQALPTTILVDRHGLARACFTGFPPGHEEALAEQIEALLAEPAAGSP